MTINWKRVARLGGFGLAAIPVVLLAVTALAAWLYADGVLHPGCQGDRASLEVLGYQAEAVTFPSRSGPVLRGWYTRGSQHPESVIIVLTGHAGNTWATLADAAIVTEAGYSTLIYEHRSCADPSLAASTGYTEAWDALGAIDYLKSRPDVEHIGGLGFSEGGTSLLIAGAQDPALEAIVAMGGYSNLEDDILDLHAGQGWYERLFRRMIVWSISIQLGAPARASDPVGMIGEISPRPILLIYGEYEAGPGRALYEAAGEPKELWIVPGTGHGGYSSTAPDEYRQRIVAFFDASLGKHVNSTSTP